MSPLPGSLPVFYLSSFLSYTLLYLIILQTTMTDTTRIGHWAYRPFSSIRNGYG